MSTSVATALALLRADPHKWGEGRVHQIDTASDRTMCGKTPAACPGVKFRGSYGEVTCQACRNAVEATARQAVRAREAREEQAQWERQRQQEREFWWARYDQYLLTDVWRAKREMVFQRADGICEGCGILAAEQVHHTRYPRDCAPGSAEWIAKEMLFDLRAICTGCHEDLHRKDWDEFPAENWGGS
jgi:5-methylcytosine-specific restriction endonuclease McrA